MLMAVTFGSPATMSTQVMAGSVKSQSCIQGEGAMWTDGALDPVTAAGTQQQLAQIGIDANIQARSYGETDSCGNYSPHGFDFTVTLVHTDLSDPTVRQQFIDKLLPVLRKFGKPNLGNVTLTDSGGQTIPVHPNQAPLKITQTLKPASLPANAMFKKVYVIVYDPLLRNGQALSQYEHWQNYADLTQQTIDFFRQVSGNQLNYSVTYTTIVNSGWPQLVDGFTYTEDTFLAVLANHNLAHTPGDVDYTKIVTSPQFDICGKVNRGEIDEVWIYNAPWFGFHESTLAGPGAYFYNSEPVPGPNDCTKMVPIMGPSVERSIPEAVHNFGHRAESTMKFIYGSWVQNSIAHAWDKFALLKSSSPSFDYSGCGNVHAPPNATAGYDYSDLASVLTNCDDFANYPGLAEPSVVSHPVDCTAWGCSQMGFLGYWFSHIPSAVGCGPDGYANDWWDYIANPMLATQPTAACQAGAHLISGNAGMDYATLNYTNEAGEPTTIHSNASGYYILQVPNGWSGTITPTKPGWIFMPDSLVYDNVTTDQKSQDYSSIAIPNYTLTVASPYGTVSRNPDQASYHKGDVVQLRATPYTGWAFAGWSGDQAGSANPAWVTINGDTTVTANYAKKEYTLTVASANGIVTRDPDQATYHEGDVVQLTAAPYTGWAFAGWGGDLAGSTNPASVTIHGNTAITASYTENEYTLTITSPYGTVARNPDKSTYHEGDLVKLTAVPNNSWSFANWTGALTGGTNPASVTIHGNTAVTASYTQSEFTLTITSPHGTVAKDPDQATYHEGDVVQLTVAPFTGWSFASWSGALIGSSNPASVTIHGNTTVTANYTSLAYTLTFLSIGVQDGWVLESSATSSKGGSMNAKATTINLGDDAAKKQYLGILSFDTGAALPDNAVVTSVILKLKRQSVVGGGNPVSIFKGFLADIKNGSFNAPALEIKDFQAAKSGSYGPFSPALAGGWYSLDLSAGSTFVNDLGLTQIRLRFKLGDNNNAVANTLAIFSGNAPAGSQPQLIITYHLP